LLIGKATLPCGCLLIIGQTVRTKVKALSVGLNIQDEVVSSHGVRTLLSSCRLLAAAVTILLSSFLLFLVQPLLAKQTLPWFGGSAGVWTVCLTFFQVVLVLGYAYAHLLTQRLRGSHQLMVHISLLCLSCLALPVIPAAYWKSAHGAPPAWQILGLLVATIGLPYFMLASTGPLLQAWLIDSFSSTLRSRYVYRLFAWSNLGSLAGLLSYPFAIEPLLSVRGQARAWSGAYAVFALCAASYAWISQRQRAEPKVGPASAAGAPREPALGAYAFWVGCSALGSLLLLAGTLQITQNVAPIPLLWVVPLSLYLLSFTICFAGRAGRGWYERRAWLTATLLATTAMAWALCANHANLSARIALPVFTAGIFLGCMTCHGELAQRKPDPAYLTHFYLSIALGGALGGMFVGLAAPQIFDGYWEAPLALVALAVLGLYCVCEETRAQPTTPWRTNIAVAVVGAVLILLLFGGLPPIATLSAFKVPWANSLQGVPGWGYGAGCAAGLVIGAALLQRYHLLRATALMTLLCVLSFEWSYYRNLAENTELWRRNFYGTLRVNQYAYGREKVRFLMHGVILHGGQIVEGPLRDMPITYYGHSSGVARAIESEQRSLSGRLRIGCAGLGAGTLAAYARAGDLFRVYELNPAVLEIANRQFTFLRDSPAQVEAVLGDARMSMEEALERGEFANPEQRFDVLSIDAFSGDAIPMHLLTREAFAVYERVIKPDGVIAFNLTNRFLDLPQVVGQIAHEAGFQAILMADRPTLSLLAPSDWVLVTRNVSFLHRPEIASSGTAIRLRDGVHAWTDQYASLFEVLK